MYLKHTLNRCLASWLTWLEWALLAQPTFGPLALRTGDFIFGDDNK